MRRLSAEGSLNVSSLIFEQIERRKAGDQEINSAANPELFGTKSFSMLSLRDEG